MLKLKRNKKIVQDLSFIITIMIIIIIIRRVQLKRLYQKSVKRQNDKKCVKFRLFFYETIKHFV